MRYLLDIAYNGTNYHGWQMQNNAVSVQQILEEALSRLLREPIRITGSGRTDTGVHAEQQPAHFDIEKELDCELILFRLNAMLPPDVAIKVLEPTNEGFHARFSAKKRRYAYRICRKKNPFMLNQCYLFARPLNIEAMNEAAKLLLQWEDFECFSKVATDVKHFRCNVTEAQWVENGNELIFYVSANRFLRNMVRAIVGTLLDVGEGKISVDDVQKILESRKRSKAGRSAPAQGLYLIEVTY